MTTPTTATNDADADADAASASAVPNSLLLDYVRRATDELNRHPHRRRRDGSSAEASSAAPPSGSLRNIGPSTGPDSTTATETVVERKRLELIGLQVEALRDVVEGYNEANTTGGVTVEGVQLALRRLGSSPPSSDDGSGRHAEGGDGDEAAELRRAVGEMNDAARLALARSVLIAALPELDCDDGGGSEGGGDEGGGGGEDDVAMDRSRVLEYCGLCSAAVRLPGVRRHLGTGSHIRFVVDDHEEEGELDAGKSEGGVKATVSSSSQVDDTPERRLVRLQRLLLLSVLGRRPGLGIDDATPPSEVVAREVHRMLHDSSDANDDDDLLVETLDSYLSSARDALAEADATDSSVPPLSDVDEGGVTRVVSVSYSEKVIGDDGDGDPAAPGTTAMEQRREEERKRELHMAKMAAEVRTGMVEELLAMDHEERGSILAKAKEVHEEFVAGAMEVPPGPERVAFMTGWGEEGDGVKRRLLLMHKLWEGRAGNR